MSNEPTTDSMTPEERARLRKQMSDQAVRLAVSSRWEEAAQLNREHIRMFGEDSEALNRLGKALTELGQITEARKYYSRSLELDPTNTIARKNLDKLAGMKDVHAAAQPPSQLDTRLFIEETGKATTATLQAVDPERTYVLDAGDLVELEVQGNAVNVKTQSGDYIGMVEPKVGLRLAKMMTAGNRYSAAMVTVTGQLKVMIRETFQHPSMIGRVSFPTAKAADVRGYTRRGLLRTDDDLAYGDDDDYEEEPEETWADSGDDDLASNTVEVDVDTGDDDSFD